MKRKVLDYKHVIWDWNGTLMNDAWLCVEVLNELLRVRQMPPVYVEDYRREFCFPVIDYYAHLGFDTSPDAFAGTSQEYIRLYNDRRFTCQLHLETEGILHTLQEAGIAQWVLSAYRQDLLEETIGHYQLRPFFKELSGLDNIYAACKKENGRRLLQQLACHPDEVLFVGDTLHDFEVAEDLSIDCALMAHGHNEAELLLEAHESVFADFAELLAYGRE